MSTAAQVLTGRADLLRAHDPQRPARTDVIVRQRCAKAAKAWMVSRVSLTQGYAAHRAQLQCRWLGYDGWGRS